MTVSVMEHRRARAFADAVEDRSAAAPDEGGLLALVDALGEVAAPGLDPQVRMTQRALLMAEFERTFAGGAGAAVPAPRRRGAHRAARVLTPGTRWGRRLALGGIAATMAFGTIGGVATASTSSLPGEGLYGMKRGLEDLRLNLAGSDAERGRLLLDQSATRMAEAQALLAEHHGGQGLSPDTVAAVHRALSDMKAEGTRGRDLLNAIYRRSHQLEPLRQLAAFADTQSLRLAQLEPRLPDQLDPIAGQVHQFLSGISTEVETLLPAAPVPGGTPQAGQSSPTSHLGDPTSVPRGATSAGTGTSPSMAASPSATPSPSGSTTSGTGVLGGVGGVGGVTGVLTGSSPSATPSDSPSPSSSTSSDGHGLTIPPLLPGLLPTIGIGLSGGG
ncbi:DUF5667 domain-containing protein [Streptacidiphilus monticola]|uniref:DUF5667 domain-containing protein n=1 Tax=Streptacidiphilus monticola TaxID=2161674 RepID=A0ABW1FYK2_9ACTN